MTKGVFLSWALVTRSRVEIARWRAATRRTRRPRSARHRRRCRAVHLLIPEILERLADVAREAAVTPKRRGSSERRTRFAGAWGRSASRFSTRPMRHAFRQLRAALGDNDFDEAWAEGAALSTEEAIAYAQRGRGERKRPASGWASLTPTERDVVRLVGEGLGNKDVAARLFVSPRTVESHLTHVYTKLGLSSRVQLAQEATRRGDVD